MQNKHKNKQKCLDVIQTALNITEIWCNSVGLSVNPEKMEVIEFTGATKYPEDSGLTYMGASLPLKQSVKYLGITINRKLKWRQHVFSKINLAKRNLIMLNRAVGSTWGLTPKTMKWIYEAIVVPRVTYGAIIWWQATNLVTIKTQLDSLQGAANRKILGCARNTPIRTMEVLTNTNPLDIRIKELALKTAYRLKSWGQWNELDFGHSNIIESEGNETIKNLAQMPKDNDQRRYMDQKLYKTEIRLRKEWEKGTPNELKNTELWYTDGSRKENLTGAAWTNNKGTDRYIKLGEYPTVYQAELLAVQMCAREIKNRDCNQEMITICSDSQAVIKSLQKMESRSKLLWETHEALNDLGKTGKVVRLTWIPGHSGHTGNEKADKLANKGSDSQPVGPQPMIGIPTTIYELQVEKWSREKRDNKWIESKGLKHSKSFLGDDCWPAKRVKGITGLERKETRRMVETITGFAPLNKYLEKIGRATTNKCTLCEEESETPEHLVRNCPATIQKRLTYLGKHSIEGNILEEVGWRKIKRYMEEINPWKN